jgi:nucleotide-binding universal stress UspA family protein
MPVVCATRFTDESKRALTVAAVLARKRGTPLHLVHVAGSGLFGRSVVGSPEKALDDEVQRLIREGCQATGTLLTGRLDEALKAFCAEKDAEILVVGDSAKRAPTLLASSLDQLAFAVEAPLLVVRDDLPFVRWGPDAPLKVMMAFDRTASAAVARDWLVRLAAFGPIQLLGAHAFDPDFEYAARRIPPTIPGTGNQALARRIEAEVRAEFEGLPANVSVRFKVEEVKGDVGEQLLIWTLSEGVDLVLLGTHRRRSLGRLFSVSHKVLLNAPVAVACVPSTTPVPHVARRPAWTSALAVHDLTESGSRAVAWAASLLRPGSALHVVHVSDSPRTPELEAALRRKLDSSLPVDPHTSSLAVSTHLRFGEAEDELEALLVSLDADVLVVGAVDVPEFENSEEGVIAPEVQAQWQLVQTLLERTRRAVLLTPPLVV